MEEGARVTEAADVPADGCATPPGRNELNELMVLVIESISSVLYWSFLGGNDPERLSDVRPVEVGS